MITCLKYSSLLKDDIERCEAHFLDDLKLVMICAGIAMAKKSGNPLWAQSCDMSSKFDTLYKEYIQILKDVCDDTWESQLQHTRMLCEYIGFTFSPYRNGESTIMRFYRATHSEQSSAAIILKYRVDKNRHITFFEQLQAKGDLTHLAANAHNCLLIMNRNASVKAEILEALENLKEDEDIHRSYFFKSANAHILSYLV